MLSNGTKADREEGGSVYTEGLLDLKQARLEF